jgi:hypothetical protein
LTIRSPFAGPQQPSAVHHAVCWQPPNVVQCNLQWKRCWRTLLSRRQRVAIDRCPDIWHIVWGGLSTWRFYGNPAVQCVVGEPIDTDGQPTARIDGVILPFFREITWHFRFEFRAKHQIRQRTSLKRYKCLH